MNVVDGVTHVLEISYWLRMVVLLALTLGIVWKCVGKRLRAWACAGAFLLVATVFCVPVWHLVLPCIGCGQMRVHSLKPLKKRPVNVYRPLFIQR